MRKEADAGSDREAGYRDELGGQAAEALRCFREPDLLARLAQRGRPVVGVGRVA